MLTPAMLERATPGYRRGYNDAVNGRPELVDPVGIWAERDYAEGFAAGKNDMRWAARRAGWLAD